MDFRQVRNAAEVVQMTPFSSERKAIGVVVKAEQGKYSPSIYSLCTQVDLNQLIDLIAWELSVINEIMNLKAWYDLSSSVSSRHFELSTT